jgi:2-(3-amino-3-carboxypropyl)histidine synthase
MQEVIKKLKKLGAKKIFIQFGEGLKLQIQKIAEKFEKEGFQVFICLEPCYGACDVRDNEAKLLGCDAILHIGHEKFVKKTSLPVVYWEYFIEANPLPILEKEFLKLKNFEKIGLITSIQFVKLIPIVKKFLEERGKKVFSQKSLRYAGQILGCDLRAAKAIEKKVDCFLCISAGKFYGAGVVLITNKPVLNLDLEKGEIYSLENFKKKTEKILAWNKSLFNEAKNVGILVSWKKGQLKNPLPVKEEVEKLGKKVYILAMDEITPEKLEGLKIDFLINLACPRIGVDDLEKFKIPVLNFSSLKDLNG